MGMILTRRYNVDRFGYLIPHRYGNLPMVGAVATYRPGEGRFGGAVAVEEGTTNLIDPLAVGMYSNNSAIWPVQDEPFGDHRRVRRNPDFETYPDSRFSTYTSAFYDHDAGIYTCSIKVKPERDVFLRLGSGEYVLCKAGIWTTLINVIEHTEQGAIRFPGINAPLTEPFGFDFNPWIEYKEAQVEAKPFATSFVNGTRAAGRLTHLAKDIINPAAGTIHLYLQAPVLDKDWFLWDTRVNRHHAFYRASTGELEIFWNDSKRMSAALPPDKAWHTITVMWQGEQTSLLIDGEDKATGTIPDEIQLADGERFTLGSRSNYVDQATKLIDELLILPYAASEEEIASWYEAQEPLPPHPQALLQWDWQAVRPAQMVKL